MTDEENQRQRHLAEVMLAQCDGKRLQSLYVNPDRKEVWHDECDAAIMYHDELHLRTFRIKPEPREWWICLKCNRRFTGNLRDHRDMDVQSASVCQTPLTHVREVLEP